MKQGALIFDERSDRYDIPLIWRTTTAACTVEKPLT